MYGQLATYGFRSVSLFNTIHGSYEFFLCGKKPGTTAAISTIKHRNNYSQISITWLEYVSRAQNKFIQHIGNSEHEFYDYHTKRSVDGYCFSTNTIYQFHGCYYHGCPKCYRGEHKHPQKLVSYQILYNQTIEHTTELRKHYRVIEIWECEWKRKYQPTDYDKELVHIITDRDELFYGGRTEVFSAYCNDNENNKIEYHDVCSLYPTVCAHDILPIGYPIRYFGQHARDQSYRLQKNLSRK
jgi:hypothetical protein